MIILCPFLISHFFLKFFSDILVFCTGQEEIESMIAILRQTSFLLPPGMKLKTILINSIWFDFFPNINRAKESDRTTSLRCAAIS